MTSEPTEDLFGCTAVGELEPSARTLLIQRIAFTGFPLSVKSVYRPVLALDHNFERTSMGKEGAGPVNHDTVEVGCMVFQENRAEANLPGNELSASLGALD